METQVSLGAPLATSHRVSIGVWNHPRPPPSRQTVPYRSPDPSQLGQSTMFGLFGFGSGMPRTVPRACIAVVSYAAEHLYAGFAGHADAAVPGVRTTRPRSGVGLVELPAPNWAISRTAGPEGLTCNPAEYPAVGAPRNRPGRHSVQTV